MVLKPARRLANSLQYQPTASKPSGRLYNFLKTVLTASQLSYISHSSSSELQLTCSRAGSWSGYGTINSAEQHLYSSAGLLCFLAVGKLSSRHQLTAGRSGKIKLTCVVFVAPPSFIALQRIPVREITGRIILFDNDGLAARLLDDFVTKFVRTNGFEAVWTALNLSDWLLNHLDAFKYIHVYCTCTSGRLWNRLPVLNPSPTYMYDCIYTCTQYIRMYMYVRVCIYMYVHVCTCTLVCVYMV